MSIRPPSQGKQDNTKKSNVKRQPFRIQNVKLSPNFKNNFSQLPSQGDNLAQKLADSSAHIKQLQNQVAELTKLNEQLETRLKRANNTIAEYWIRVKDSEKNLQSTSQRLNSLTNRYKTCRDKKKMYKRRIIDALNYFYKQQSIEQNAPFLQLEELKQILLSLGMHDSILQEMQEVNTQIENGQQVNVDNMTYEQLLALQERIGSQTVGLSKEQIKKLPKTHKEDDGSQDLCTVCYEFLEVGNKFITLPCTHLYHSKCIKAWLLNHKKCPVCNIDVKVDE